jgi:hypothetical protein
MQDRDAKGRGGEAKRRGRGNGLARLDEATVRAIRAERAQGMHLSAIAARHGVATPTVHHVITRRTWAHVA